MHQIPIPKSIASWNVLRKATPHRALHKDDILREIFERLSTVGNASLAGEERALCQRTLAISARVCKDFLDPALDVLWRELADFLDLMKIILPSAKTTTRGPHNIKVETLSGELTPEHAARFFQYARRVRSIPNGIIRPETLLDPPSVYSYLADQNHGAPLLPQLQELRWQITSAAAATTLITLVPKSLRRLRLDFQDSRFNENANIDSDQTAQKDAIHSFLRTLRSKTPSLAYLVISGYVKSTAESWLPVAEFTRLQSLHIVITDPTLLPHIAQMPCLSELSMSLFLPEDDELRFGDCPFPALRDVTIQVTGNSLAYYTRILGAVTSAHMESVYMSVNFDGRPQSPGGAALVEQYHGLYRVLGSTPSAPSLRKVQLDIWLHCNMGGVPENRATLVAEQPLIEIFGPLLSSRTLEVLRFVQYPCCPLPVILSDGDIRQVAEAWPNLQSLLLRYKTSRSLPTIHVLADIARLCPNLEHLFLPGINTSETPDLSGNWQSSSPLRELYLIDGGGDADADRFARILDRCFPFLDISSLLYRDRSSTWLKIVGTLSRLQRTRNPE
ncbi:hypothetical protein A0H81_06374 [Grifola frondosa]|uniref:F-box domain-containing protein n=1 Tax=Grifola frondosa TaxID=5627 RepID=A0A1C7MAB2_GRIFR|nr:hypothetical protein A0H81_06374 [Grifola frondosa]